MNIFHYLYFKVLQVTPILVAWFLSSEFLGSIWASIGIGLGVALTSGFASHHLMRVINNYNKYDQPERCVEGIRAVNRAEMPEVTFTLMTMLFGFLADSLIQVGIICLIVCLINIARDSYFNIYLLGVYKYYKVTESDDLSKNDWEFYFISKDNLKAHVCLDEMIRLGDYTFLQQEGCMFNKQNKD